jgi:RimJ/RimL family protein N-acetyltransferase
MDLFAENVTLRTARLTLRPVLLSDEAVIVREIGDIAVSRWLSRVPHPYAPADFHAFATDYATPGETFVIVDDSGPVGCIGLEPNILGYWLATGVHGRGYATEASRALLDRHFSQSDQPIFSGYFEGNSPSARVLEKLGFVETGRDMKLCQALGGDRPHVNLVLTPQVFNRA